MSICMPVLYWLDGISEIPALSLKDLCRQGGSKIVRMRSGISSQNNSIFQIQQKRCRNYGNMYKTYTRSIQTHTNKKDGKRPWHVTPRWRTIGIWLLFGKQKAGFFFFINWHLAYQPHSKAGLTPRSSHWKQTGFDVSFYF